MADGFGFFGKIPGAGDFLRHRLPSDFVEGWDQWLQRGILYLRDALGAGWNERYMTAPIWRFALPAGACGRSPVFGILMPSVDRVGRQFPLSIASVCGPDALAQHQASSDTFARLEAIALDTLEHDRGRDALETALSAVPETTSAGNCPPPVVAPGLITSCRVKGSAIDAFGAAQISQSIKDPCIWSSEAGDLTRFMATDGLPEQDRMTAIFDLDAPTWQLGHRSLTEEFGL